MAGHQIAKRFPYTILNPLLLSAIFVAAILLVFHIDYETYDLGAQYLSYLLTPATICLAVPMYRQIRILRTHLAAILCSMFAGCVACALVILSMSWLFHLIRRFIMPSSPNPSPRHCHGCGGRKRGRTVPSQWLPLL